MKHEAESSRLKGRNGACPCPDCRLPPQGPPAWLRAKAVSIWSGTYFTELATELGQDAAEETGSRENICVENNHNLPLCCPDALVARCRSPSTLQLFQ